MSAAFSRVSESTYEDWQLIGQAVAQRQRGLADRVMALLRSLEEIWDGFPVSQLEHALQTAARAQQADAGEQLIVAALCHDIGKAISVPGHGDLAAALLRPYVPSDVSWVVSVHEKYQGAHYYEHIGLDPNARRAYEQHPAHGLAVQFVDDWDEPAFDPTALVPGLDAYEPVVRDVFSQPWSDRS